MTELFNRLLGNNKIRKKLLMYFMLTTFLMAATSFYTYYNARMLMDKMNTMFVSNVELNALYNNVNKVEQFLESFLATKHSDSLKDYLRNRDALRLKTESTGKDMPMNESGLLLKDIKNMIDTYLTEADAAVQSKRGRDINEYIAHYNEANKIFGYIDLYINKLNNGLLQENTNRYLAVADRLNIIQLVNIGIIIGVVIFNIILILWFTFKITKPIVNLSHSADEISRGNFDVQEVVVDTDDEISVMADAFNRMTASIKLYIDEIKEKAKLESRLKEQEMQNLSMKAHLKEAELQALQSQINPHFIFNTLNAGAQIAMFEGADKTCVFVENVANLFRYNLKKLDKPVTLREEINNINTYLFILKARFADRIEFVQDIDESALDINMPCMILQPLVENAFIHGIGEMEQGGRISLIVRKGEGSVEVIIKDNGRGMDDHTILKILRDQGDTGIEQDHVKKGHTTGIGMNNVISRLNLFFNSEDILDIRSKPDMGTEVVLNMPYKNN